MDRYDGDDRAQVGERVSEASGSLRHRQCIHAGADAVTATGANSFLLSW